MSECFETGGCTGEGRWMDYHYWQLAGLYKKSTCLWKKDGRYYLDCDRRYRAYQKIQEAMGVPGLSLVGVVLKIREMRRMYVQELKRLLDRELCGCCHNSSIAWFYDLHRFLYPYLDYDEAVELHNVARPAADPRETDDRDPDRDSEDRYHSDCPLKRRDRLCEGRFPAPGIMHSISSPAVSLPEVKAQPGTCPRSCVDASCERRTVGRRSVGVDVASSSSCCEKSCHRILSASDASTGTRQERCCEFRIRGLSGSSSYTCETDSSDESFSTIVSRCLSKLDTPFAIRAKMEILRLLRSLMEESKKSMGR